MAVYIVITEYIVGRSMTKPKNEYVHRKDSDQPGYPCNHLDGEERAGCFA